MSRWISPFFLLILICTLCVACEKDAAATIRGSGGSQSSIHLQLGVDSACVQAPNVFTPDGDGVNDVFYVHARNTQWYRVRITNSAGVLISELNDSTMVWDGQDSTGSGPYTINVYALSTSGIPLYGQHRLSILSYGTTGCLSYSGSPVTGDQLDPRICGISYDSHENFCP